MDMDEYFAAIPVSNATVLCAGGIREPKRIKRAMVESI